MGRRKRSANAPERPRMPKTVRVGQWFCSPARQPSQLAACIDFSDDTLAGERTIEGDADKLMPGNARKFVAITKSEVSGANPRDFDGDGGFVRRTRIERNFAKLALARLEDKGAVRRRCGCDWGVTHIFSQFASLR